MTKRFIKEDIHDLMMKTSTDYAVSENYGIHDSVDKFEGLVKGEYDDGFWDRWARYRRSEECRQAERQCDALIQRVIARQKKDGII